MHMVAPNETIWATNQDDSVSVKSYPCNYIKDIVSFKLLFMVA
jgi:hypothetical protein